MSTVVSPFPEYTPPPPDPPARWCSACLDRKHVKVPIYRLDLCEACFTLEEDDGKEGPNMPIFLLERTKEALKAYGRQRVERQRQERYEHQRLSERNARNILEAVADYYGTIPEALVSKTRAGFKDEPRHVARYLIREMLQLSLADIGRIVHTDHACVLRSINQVEMRPQVYAKPIREVKKKFAAAT